MSGLVTLATITHALNIGRCQAFTLRSPSHHHDAICRRFQQHSRHVLKLSESPESRLENQFETLIKAATVDAEGRVLGGDFAGLAATFSPGKFVAYLFHIICSKI